MKWIFMLLVAVSADAGAQSVYKCRDAKGNPVYQSDPCPDAEKRWDTQPQSYTWDDYRKRQAADRKIEADRRHMRSKAQQIASSELPVSANVGPRDSDNCRRVKAQRDAAYEAMGVSRNFEASRYWDDAVWNACK